MDEQGITGEAPVAATPEPQAQPVVETAPTTPTADAKPPQDTAEQETKKALRGVQKRIDELTRARYDAEERGKQEAEHWRREALAAKQQLEAFSRTQQAPRLDQFASLEEFSQAAARHESEKVVREALEAERRAYAEYMQQQTQAQQQQVAERQFLTELNKRIEAGEKKFPGFRDAIQSPELPSIAGTAAFGAIWESEIGDEVMHYLTKNPAKAHQIVSLSPTGQVKEITRIEAAIQAGKTVSAAPAPPATVGGTNSGITKKPEEMSYDEFVAYRRRQIAQRR